MRGTVKHSQIQILASFYAALDYFFFFFFLFLVALECLGSDVLLLRSVEASMVPYYAKSIISFYRHRITKSAKKSLLKILLYSLHW